MLPNPVSDKHALKSTATSTMQPVFWKALSALLLLCILVQQFSWRRSLLPEHIVPLDRSWTYDWKRDHNNHGLSAAQCDAAFPDLYSEIDRALDHWKHKKITSDSIDLYKENDGGLRVLIADQQLRIIETKGLERKDFRHRIIGLLQQIQRAITAAEHTGEELPNTEFTIIVDDKPILAKPSDEPGAVMAFARQYANPRHDNIWLIPDFHFFGAPPEAEGWRETQKLARQHDSRMHDKIPQVVWRGVKWTNEEIRLKLVNVAEGKEWADVKAMDWSKPANRMPMDEFCKYRYTVNTEGRSWSARLTSLLNCDSLVMVHDVEWIAHYYHLLDPGVNCVRVERNFTDLEEKIYYYNNHTTEAQLIADTARSTFREKYTTPAATACYWRKLMRAYSSVAFEPEVLNTTRGVQSHRSVSGLRGVSFEEFIVHNNTEDYPWWVKRKKPTQVGKSGTKDKSPPKKKPEAANDG